MLNTRSAKASQIHLLRGCPAPLYRREPIAGAYFGTNRVWEKIERRRTLKLLARQRAERTTDTCVVVGNGPSLNDLDLSCLNETDVFISNYAYKHEFLINSAKHLAIVNHLVAEQGASELIHICTNRAECAPKLQSIVAPSHIAYCLSEDPIIHFVQPVHTPAFQQTPYQGASCQSTVTYLLLQLAYWVGYRRVLLIGVDNQYVQPEGAAEGAILRQEGIDPNHFSGDYFADKQWHAASPDRMSAAYELAHRTYSASGREIINCTAGGALTVFPRSELHAELSKQSSSYKGYSQKQPSIGQLFEPRPLIDSFVHWSGACFVLASLVLVATVLRSWSISEMHVTSGYLSLILAECTVLAATGLLISHNRLKKGQDRIEFETLTLKASINRTSKDG